MAYIEVYELDFSPRLIRPEKYEDPKKLYQDILKVIPFLSEIEGIKGVPELLQNLQKLCDAFIAHQSQEDTKNAKICLEQIGELYERFERTARDEHVLKNMDQYLAKNPAVKHMLNQLEDEEAEELLEGYAQLQVYIQGILLAQSNVPYMEEDLNWQLNDAAKDVLNFRNQLCDAIRESKRDDYLNDLKLRSALNIRDHCTAISESGLKFTLTEGALAKQIILFCEENIKVIAALDDQKIQLEYCENLLLIKQKQARESRFVSVEEKRETETEIAQLKRDIERHKNNINEINIEYKTKLGAFLIEHVDMPSNPEVESILQACGYTMEDLRGQSAHKKIQKGFVESILHNITSSLPSFSQFKRVAGCVATGTALGAVAGGPLAMFTGVGGAGLGLAGGIALEGAIKGISKAKGALNKALYGELNAKYQTEEFTLTDSTKTFDPKGHWTNVFGNETLARMALSVYVNTLYDIDIALSSMNQGDIDNSKLKDIYMHLKYNLNKISAGKTSKEELIAMFKKDVVVILSLHDQMDRNIDQDQLVNLMAYTEMYREYLSLTSPQERAFKPKALPGLLEESVMQSQPQYQQLEAPKRPQVTTTTTSTRPVIEEDSSYSSDVEFHSMEGDSGDEALLPQTSLPLQGGASSGPIVEEIDSGDSDVEYQLKQKMPDEQDKLALVAHSNVAESQALTTQTGQSGTSMALVTTAQSQALTHRQENRMVRQMEGRLATLESQIAQKEERRAAVRGTIHHLAQCAELFGEIGKPSQYTERLRRENKDLYTQVTQLPLERDLAKHVLQLLGGNPSHLVKYLREDCFGFKPQDIRSKVCRPMEELKGETLWHILAQHPEGDKILKQIIKVQNQASSVLGLGEWELGHYFEPSRVVQGMNPIQRAIYHQNEYFLLELFTNLNKCKSSLSQSEMKQCFSFLQEQNPNIKLFCDKLMHEIESLETQKTSYLMQSAQVVYSAVPYNRDKMNQLYFQIMAALSMRACRGESLPETPEEISEFLRIAIGKHNSIDYFEIDRLKALDLEVDGEVWQGLCQNIHKFIQGKNRLKTYLNDNDHRLTEMQRKFATHLAELDLSKHDQKVILLLLENNHEMFIKKCQKADLHKDFNGINLLYMACACGHVEIAKHLYKNGTTVDNAGFVGNPENRDSAFICAAREGHTQVIQAILEVRAESYASKMQRALVDTSGMCAMHYLARSGDIEGCLAILQSEKKQRGRHNYARLCNLLDKTGATPLHYLVDSHCIEGIKQMTSLLSDASLVRLFEANPPANSQHALLTKNSEGLIPIQQALVHYNDLFPSTSTEASENVEKQMQIFNFLFDQMLSNPNRFLNPNTLEELGKHIHACQYVDLGFFFDEPLSKELNSNNIWDKEYFNKLNYIGQLSIYAGNKSVLNQVLQQCLTAKKIHSSWSTCLSIQVYNQCLNLLVDNLDKFENPDAAQAFSSIADAYELNLISKSDFIALLDKIKQTESAHLHLEALATIALKQGIINDKTLREKYTVPQRPEVGPRQEQPDAQQKRPSEKKERGRPILLSSAQKESEQTSPGAANPNQEKKPKQKEGKKF